MSELEKQKLLLEEQRQNWGRKPDAFEELFELAMAFLSKPYKLRRSGNLQLQKLVLRLTFAEHLRYVPKEGFSNAKTTMPFRLLESFRTGGNEMARPKGEPLTPRFEVWRPMIASSCNRSALGNSRSLAAETPLYCHPQAPPAEVKCHPTDKCSHLGSKLKSHQPNCFRTGERRENILPSCCPNFLGFWAMFAACSGVARRDDKSEVKPKLLIPLYSNGGRDRDRTCDPYHVKVVLYR